MMIAADWRTAWELFQGDVAVYVVWGSSLTVVAANLKCWISS